MFRCALICLCIVVIYGRDFPGKVLKLNPSSECDRNFLPDSGLGTVSCTGLTADHERVISGGHCIKHLVEPTENDVKYECRDGQWSTSQKLERHKRWDWISGSVGDLASTLTCPAAYQTPEPPVFPAGKCTPETLNLIGTLAKNSDVTTVTWNTPQAFDSSGNSVGVTQVWGVASGSQLQGSVWGREYSVVYQATDNQGLIATCAFNFLVTVATCPSLPWPDNGYYTCSLGNQTGSTCTYGCLSGYELTEPSMVTCQTSSWSAIPTCEKISCGAPLEMANGTVTCGDDSDAYTYGATCTLSCHEGYRLHGSLYTRCGEDGAWAMVQNATCLDDTPPRISCRTPQLFYTDRGLNTTTVTPEVPVATDNLDPSPSVVMVTGPVPGATLETGSYDVQYKAVDANGNESPECTVELRVLDITCGHPLEAITDTNMQFDCTGYNYGDTCALDCYANLPLEGTDLLSCERNDSLATPVAYWSWGLGPMPYCGGAVCPDLNPPLNGSLEYDTVNDAAIITMTCDPGFAVPSMGSNFNGVIICHSTGWSPGFERKVPECVVTEQALFHYSTKILYYSGECTDPALLATYTSSLQTSVDEAHTRIQEVCPGNATCSVHSPSVSCVEAKRRRRSDGLAENVIQDNHRRGKRRSTLREWSDGSLSRHKRQAGNDHLLLTFVVQAEFDHSNMDIYEMWDAVDALQTDFFNPALQSMIEAGEFDLDPWSLQSDSLQSALGETACGSGYPKETVRICMPCPVGYYLDGDQCEACPVGQCAAEAGVQACTTCPVGYSTRFTASESLESCIPLCGPGTYSPDRFEPCAACPIGHYQDSVQQTSCIKCPAGKTTIAEGVSDEADCLYYDALLGDTSDHLELASDSTLGNLTLMFWIRATTDSMPNVNIYVHNVLVVSLADTVTIRTPASSFLQTFDPAPSDTWDHLAVVWDTGSDTLAVYRNGQLAVRQVLVSPPSDPLVQNGYTTISSDGVSGMYLSGFNLLDDVFSDTQVANAATSCHLSYSNDVINMGAFSDVDNGGVTLIAPSLCDATDECQSSPCGSHVCHNHVGGYTCTCYNGWSGDTCDTPPDLCDTNDCENGATCLSGSTDYTCQCPPGYAGTLCDEAPGDGGLSAWSTWSECSATCDTGTRSRVRSCDSPGPDIHGNTCTGHLEETEACNTDICPECPPLVGDAVTGYTCTTDVTSGLQTCTTQCTDGYMVPSDTGTWVYSCSVDTGYTWQPAPGGLATCVAPVVPSSIVMTSTVTYSSAIPFDDVTNVKSQVLDNTVATDCHASSTCVNHIALSNAVMTLTSTVTLSDTSDMRFDQYVSNGIVSSSLQGVIDATSTLESTAAHINASVSSVFDVTVSSTTYTVDPASLTMCVSVECEPGYVETAGLCAPSSTTTTTPDTTVSTTTSAASSSRSSSTSNSNNNTLVTATLPPTLTTTSTRSSTIVSTRTTTRGSTDVSGSGTMPIVTTTPPATSSSTDSITTTPLTSTSTTSRPSTSSSIATITATPQATQPSGTMKSSISTNSASTDTPTTLSDEEVVDPRDDDEESDSPFVYVLIAAAVILALALVVCVVLLYIYKRYHDRKKTPPSPTGNQVWHNDDEHVVQTVYAFNIPAVARREPDFNIPAVDGDKKRKDMFMTKVGYPGLNDINTDVESAAVPKGGQAMLKSNETGNLVYPTKVMSADGTPMKARDQRREGSGLYSARCQRGKELNKTKGPIITDTNSNMELPAYKKCTNGPVTTRVSQRREETPLTVSDLELGVCEYIGLEDQYVDNDFNIPAGGSPPPLYRP